VYCAVADTGSWCRELSACTGLVVLSVECDPGGLENAVFAAEWAAEHAGRLGADPGTLLIGGTGPGGALAAGVALEALARGWPAFSRQVLICASPVSRQLPASITGLAPATVLTVERDPDGDSGRYAALLRSAGIAVRELRYAAPDAAAAAGIRNSQELLADLGAALGPPPLGERHA
jgi:acetyl esterase/lipase